MTQGGIAIVSGDGRFSFELGGRVHVDAAAIDDDSGEPSSDSGTEIRRAQLSLKGTLYHDWGYKLRSDFADNEVSMKDAYLRYAPRNITIGLSKVKFSLEDLTSSNAITFMERALPNALTPGRRIGVGFSVYGRSLGFASNLYGQGVDDGNDGDDRGDEGLGIAAKLNYDPINSGAKLVHLGLAAAWEQPEDDNRETARFRERPESHIAERLVDTGTITEVDTIYRYSLEAAAVLNQFSLQAEYLRSEVNRDNGFSDSSFDGTYVFLSWFPTGESRPFKASAGKFSGIEPRADTGAWEVALRYSTLDLNSGDIKGGSEDNITAGVNWYANTNIRFMANLIKVDTDGNADNKNPKILQLRAQAVF